MMHVFYTQLVARAHHKPLMIDALALLEFSLSRPM